MQVRARYNQAVPVGEGGPVSLGWIVDDLLGIRAESPYLVSLAGHYGFLNWPFLDLIGARKDRVPAVLVDDGELAGVLADLLPDEARLGVSVGRAGNTDKFRVVKHGDLFSALARDLLLTDWGGSLAEFEKAVRPLRDTFIASANAAAEGQLAEGLAPHLGRIRRLPGGTVEAHDLPALAAWALEEKLRRGPVRVATCPSCHSLWLPDRAGLYCRRPAPGQESSCRALAKHGAFIQRHPDYHRERKKLYERMRRGTLAKADYEAWSAANQPDAWTPYTEWKPNQKGGTTRGKR